MQIRIVVPNVGSWDFRKFNQDWYCLKLPRHLVHFDPKSLSSMMELEGMKVLSLEQIGFAA